MKFQDYYETLGVSRDATPEQIRKAYRTLARKHHPDVNPNDSSAEEKFKHINEAYEVLKDPEKRKRYDQLGANWKAGQDFRPPPGFESFSFNFGGPGGGGGGGFSDFFEALFGAAGGMGGGPRVHRPRTGPTGFSGFQDFSGFEAGPGAFQGDVESEIEVPIEKIITGGQMTVRVAVPGEAPHSYDIRIPQGIAEGRKIRLSGQGRGGGDLFLKIKYAKDGPYKVEGNDLIAEARVAPWEAALGAKVPVETPGGKIALTIPSGSSSGRRLRIRGQGLPNDNGAKGDLYVQVMICVPSAPTEKEKDLLKQWAETSRFNPRD